MNGALWLRASSIPYSIRLVWCRLLGFPSQSFSKLDDFFELCGKFAQESIELMELGLFDVHGSAQISLKTSKFNRIAICFFNI